MNCSEIEIFKQLKLENDELKTVLLKLTGKYKTSELKRNVLLRRNALLITDNKNLHTLLLETNKKRIINESVVANYYSALKHMKKELNQLKIEKLSGGDQEIKGENHKSVSSCDLLEEKLSERNDDSLPYFELSDNSALNLQFVTDGSHKPEVKFRSMGTYTSEEKLMEDTKEKYIQTYFSEVNTYFQIPLKNIPIQNDNQLPEEIETKKEENETRNAHKNETEEALYDQRYRLKIRIMEFLEMREKELETRRFAVAAKTEMVQNAQKEINKIHRLIALTTQ